MSLADVCWEGGAGVGKNMQEWRGTILERPQARMGGKNAARECAERGKSGSRTRGEDCKGKGIRMNGLGAEWRRLGKGGG